MWGMIIAILNPLGKLYRLNRRRYRQHADVCLVCDAGVGYLFYMPFICSAPALTIAGWYKSIYCLWAP